MMRLPDRSYDWLDSYPRPWVVVDWGRLRAITRGDGIPSEFTAVIPDIALIEAATTARERRQSFVDKFRSIVESPASHGRILIGRYWEEIAQQETRPALPAAPVQAIEPQVSRSIRDFQSGSIGFQELTFEEAELDEYAARKQVFVVTMNRFSAWLKEREPTDWKGLATGTVTPESMLRAEAETMHKLLSSNNVKYKRLAWRKALAGFPDRFAEARWMRLIVWYALNRIPLRDQGDAVFGNNFEDAHYAFLSGGCCTNCCWVTLHHPLSSRGRSSAIRPATRLGFGHGYRARASTRQPREEPQVAPLLPG